MIIGIFRKRFGDYPEEMMVVLGKVKKEKWYDHSKLPIFLAAAFLPLVFGSSVGSEAGLVGIITAFCYWVADGLKKYAGQPLGKALKSITYGFAIAAGLSAYVVLNKVFGTAMAGFPTFEVAIPTGKDMIMAVVYIIFGCLLAKVYELTHQGSHTAAEKFPPIVKETVAGFLLGLAATFVPQIMFSGEEEIHHLMTEYAEYLPWMLLGIALLKILMTNVCIQFGLKGGHFFLLIYAGVAAGYAIAMFVFPGGTSEHMMFSAAVVTSAMLGANMKMPAVVILLLLLCFPVRMVLWLGIGAFSGSSIMSIGGRCDE
ncbi:MAG: chloride channel protein [Schaedlerella sp.]|nr:chloride channel protein [Schaedlerella sp.]